MSKTPSPPSSDTEEESEENFPSAEMTVIPEVSLPTTLSAKGKTPLQFEHQIQNWVDRQYSQTFHREEPASSSFPPASGSCSLERQQHPVTDIVAQLTNQIYLDNGEMLYILVTDVTSYILNSKPEIWLENNTNSSFLGYKFLKGSETKLDTILFNCLFHIDSEIFTLFLFSPMDITFVLDWPVPGAEEGNTKMTNVFFHGVNSKVFVTSTGNDGNEDEEITKTITIQFFEM